MKCDDDTFVGLDSVMAEVKKIPDGKSFYLGNMNYYHRPLREGKWAVSYEVKCHVYSLFLRLQIDYYSSYMA
jgi:hydroxyproline O-galactosyltransferase 2/3/4/5/6